MVGTGQVGQLRLLKIAYSFFYNNFDNFGILSWASALGHAHTEKNKKPSWATFADGIKRVGVRTKHTFFSIKCLSVTCTIARGGHSGEGGGVGTPHEMLPKSPTVP